MSETIEIVKYNIGLYYGDFLFLGIAVVAFIYLVVTSKELRGKLLFSVGLILFSVVNPLIYKYAFSDIIYWRMFWTIPDAMVVALATAKFIKNRKSKVFKLITLSVIVCLMVKFGKMPFKERAYEGVKNWYKLDKGVVEVCDIILGVDDSPRCVMPKELYSQVRQYSENIELLYGRNINGDYIIDTDINSKNVLEDVKNEDYEFVLYRAIENDCNFVITNNDECIEQGILQKYGFEEIQNHTDYNIYYCEDTSINIGWLITQYGRKSDGRSDTTCYTIEDREGNLIIVDGGNSWDKSILLDKINAHNGKVNAWILTGLENSHTGAFMDIASDNNVDIEMVFLPKVLQIQEYDSTDKRELIQKLDIAVSKASNIYYFTENEEININKLNLTVLSIQDNQDEKHGSVSVSFEIKGYEEKMLFCSDIGSSNQNTIMHYYKNKSHPNYIQAAYHGKEWRIKDFYDLVETKVVFLDASYVYFEDANYNTLEIEEYFTEKGVTVYSFITSPNRIVLR